MIAASGVVQPSTLMDLFVLAWLVALWALLLHSMPDAPQELPGSSSFTSSLMSSPTNGEDEFVHHIAIQLSRAMNLINPNDLLARRVQDIAKNNTVDGFVEGM